MRNRSDDLAYSMKDVLILDSTSPRKFSRHLIFQTKDPFLDNLTVGRFVNLILEDIQGCLMNHQCPTVLNATPFPRQPTQTYSDSAVFAKNLLATIESRLYRFQRCQCVDNYSQLGFKEIIEFIVKTKTDNELTWFCDMSVYMKNRAFRLLLSSKFDKLDYFTVAPENQWIPDLGHSLIQSSEYERRTFMASLVYFNGPVRRFIHVDDENKSKSKPVSTRSSKSSVYVTENIKEIASNYPELYNFMSNIAQDNNGHENSCRSSELYAGREIQNDFKWEISLLYKGTYKYCERIKRHHVNNNIYFVVDMRKGTYRQKCHDSDCKSFEGSEQMLPANVTPWLTVVNQEWDSQSPRSMKETL